MKIRVQGLTIELLRYAIAYTRDGIAMTQFAQTKEEAEWIAKRFDGTVTQLDTAKDEWIDGIEVKPTNMPYDAAMEIAEMGEQGYKDFIEHEKLKDPEALAKENEALKKQVTDLEMALADIYESRGV